MVLDPPLHIKLLDCTFGVDIKLCDIFLRNLGQTLFYYGDITYGYDPGLIMSYMLS